jgi:hypothetical protein
LTKRIPNLNRNREFAKEKAEPVATANGPAGPWLISNVRQKEGHMLEKYEEEGKKSLPRWVGNVRDLFLIVAAFLGFAVVAVFFIPLLPQPLSTIARILGIVVVGSFIRSLAR